MRILLAFNGTKLSETALRSVLEQHRSDSTEVNVLDVVPIYGTSYDVMQAQTLVEQAGRELEAVGFKVVNTVLKGSDNETIVLVSPRNGKPT